MKFDKREVTATLAPAGWTASPATPGEPVLTSEIVRLDRASNPMRYDAT